MDLLVEFTKNQKVMQGTAVGYTLDEGIGYVFIWSGDSIFVMTLSNIKVIGPAPTPRVQIRHTVD